MPKYKVTCNYAFLLIYNVFIYKIREFIYSQTLCVALWWYKIAPGMRKEIWEIEKVLSPNLIFFPELVTTYRYSILKRSGSDKIPFLSA